MYVYREFTLNTDVLNVIGTVYPCLINKKIKQISWKRFNTGILNLCK